MANGSFTDRMVRPQCVVLTIQQRGSNNMVVPTIMRMAMILLLCCNQAQTNASVSAFLHRVWGRRLHNSTSRISPIAVSVRGGENLQDVYDGKSEKIVSLLEWADSNGVVFAPTVRIRHDNENGMLGVYWKPSGTEEADEAFTTREETVTNKDGHRQVTITVEAAGKATRLMTIPNSFVLSSELMEDSLRIRVEDYFQQEFPDISSDDRQLLIYRFCLAFVVLDERSKGPESFGMHILNTFRKDFPAQSIGMTWNESTLVALD